MSVVYFCVSCYNKCMRVAICDDDKRQLNTITQLLDCYPSPVGSPVRYDVFNNGLDLIQAIEVRNYDVLLLDILMPQLSGIDIARDIRRTNDQLPIVFLTTSPEFAVESYRVQAFDYLLKPIKQSDFYGTLDRISALHKNNLVNSITIHTSKAVYVLPFSQIVFLEIVNRTVMFHLMDGSVKEVAGRLSDYEETFLERREFLKIHRSYIINMDMMKTLDTKSFVALTGQRLPISRNLLHSVREKYTEYLHAAIRN